VKARLTALLTLLLTISAAFGVPVTTGVSLRVSAAIVWEQRERGGEQLRPPRASPARRVFSTPSLPETAPTLLLGHALFQRPPPAA
jgi:hypothetical protein